MGVRDLSHDDLIQRLIDTTVSYRTSRHDVKSSRCILDRMNIETYKAEILRRIPPDQRVNKTLGDLVGMVLSERDASPYINDLLSRLVRVKNPKTFRHPVAIGG